MSLVRSTHVRHIKEVGTFMLFAQEDFVGDVGVFDDAGRLANEGLIFGASDFPMFVCGTGNVI